MSEELLNLSTIVDRPTITITSTKHPKGKKYQLINLADLGPYEHAVIFTKNAEVQPLLKRKRLTKPQKAKLEQTLNEMLQMICPSIERPVVGELTEQQKVTVLMAWTAHVNKNGTSGAAEGNRAVRRQTQRRRTTSK